MESRKYIKKVRAALSCSGSTKSGLMRVIQKDLDAYVSEYPTATEQDLVGRFGTPDALAESYLSSLDSAEINEQIQKARKRKRVVVICCGIVIAAILTFAVCILITVIENQPARIVTVVEKGAAVCTRVDSLVSTIIGFCRGC